MFSLIEVSPGSNRCLRRHSLVFDAALAPAANVEEMVGVGGVHDDAVRARHHRRDGERVGAEETPRDVSDVGRGRRVALQILQRREEKSEQRREMAWYVANH